MAEETGFRSPVSAVVVDAQSATLHLVQGLPGGAVLGPSVSLPFTPVTAAMCPTQNLAVVTGADRSVWVARDFGSAALTVTQLEGAVASMVVMAGGCQAALLYSAGDGTLEFAANLLREPQLGPMIRLEDPGNKLEKPVDFQGPRGRARLPTGATSKPLAVSADGSLGLVAANRQLYLVRNGTGELTLLPSIDEPVAAAFLPNGRDAAVAHHFRSELLLLLNIEEQATQLPLLSGHDGLTGAAAIAVSGEETILLLDTDSHTVFKASITTGALDRIAVPDSADRLDAALAPDIFLLNGPGRGTAHLLDLNNGVFFVPAQ